MEHRQEPSLLDYTRFHGIATDFTTPNPLDHIQNLEQFMCEGDGCFPQEKLSEFKLFTRGINEKLDGLREEKLRASKQGSRLLASFIRKIQAKRINIKWDQVLPEFNQIEDMKLEVPVFKSSYENDIPFPREPLLYTADHVHLNPIEECNTVKRPVALIEPTTTEKLICSKKTLLLIQNVREGREWPLKHVENLLEGLWETNQARLIHPISPLLRPLSPENFSPTSPPPVLVEQMLPSPISPNTVTKELGSNPAGAHIQHSKRSYDSIMNIPDIPTLEGVKRKSSFTYTPPIEGEQVIIDDTVNSMAQNDMFPSSPGYHCNIETPPRAKTNHISPSSNNDRVGLPYENTPKRTCYSTNLIQMDNNMTRGEDDLPWPEIPKHDLTNLSCTDVEDLHKRRPRILQKTPRKTPKIALNHAKGATRENNIGTTFSLPLKPFGTLLSFMETRGKVIKRQIPASSPYFPKHKESSGADEQSFAANSHVIIQCEKPELSDTGQLKLNPTVQSPQSSQQHDCLVLFVSMALLKTHLRLIQYIEGMKPAPNIIYRDYTSINPKNTLLSRTTGATLLPESESSSSEEADIIVSPQTGIILATSQASMQLHLPGHKPSSCQISNIKHVNSPLREQIFKLASRYGQIYVLICHNSGQFKESQGYASARITADRRLLSSLNSLAAFCKSISAYATVSPLLVPSSPGSVAEWVLALAHKHACQLPPVSKLQPLHSIKFTPVNVTPNLKSDFGIMEEPMWELFLRRSGLNPYAAQAVFAVMGREAYLTESTASNSHYTTSDAKHTDCLASFVELSSEKRIALFQELIGEQTLKFVNAAIAKDWQCDWR